MLARNNLKRLQDRGELLRVIGLPALCSGRGLDYIAASLSQMVFDDSSAAGHERSEARELLLLNSRSQTKARRPVSNLPR